MYLCIYIQQNEFECFFFNRVATEHYQKGKKQKKQFIKRSPKEESKKRKWEIGTKIQKKQEDMSMKTEKLRKKL